MGFSFFEKRKNLLEIKECVKEIEEFKKKAEVSDKYLLINNESCQETLRNVTLNSLKKKNSFGVKSYFGIIENWDMYGEISLELGKWMEEQLKRDDVVIGIHRTGGYGMIDPNDIGSSSMLHSIFKDGLFMTGHLSSGVDHHGEVVDPNKNISPINNILNFVMFAKSHYKGSTGGVITAIPKEFVTDTYDVKKGKENDLFTVVDGQQTLKPEFLIGFIAQDKGKCTYYDKDKILSLCEEYQNGNHNK